MARTPADRHGLAFAFFGAEDSSPVPLDQGRLCEEAGADRLPDPVTAPAVRGLVGRAL
ncbi:hypothetical protein QD712_07515 [Streptomyces acidiscabies]|uniref:hypothetical protein n=1 Tax=Streptomyces acidiscabies TaxID=42234 RepID=UPI0030D127DE